MKQHTRNLFAGMIAATLLFTLSACSESAQPDSGDGELQEQIDALTAENEELKAKIEELEGQLQAAQPAEGEGTTDTSNPSSGATPIELGTTYTIDELCEFTVTAANLSKEVLPPNPGSFYTYYQEQDGSTYLDIVVSIKNLRTTARTADEFGTVTAICDGAYEYTAFSAIEESGGTDFTYTNITSIDPLTTGVLHYIASIPNEVADDTTKTIDAEITILDNEYTLHIR